MSSPAFSLGFHGCDRSLADRVVTGTESLAPSTNPYDWLGHGTYFWENDPERAHKWARDHGCAGPAVIGAVIDLGLCLDLSQAAHLALLVKSYEHLQRLLSAADGHSRMPVNDRGFEGDGDEVKRYLDCSVINTLHTMRDAGGEPSFDTVRSPFIEGQPLYPGGKIMAKTHVLICVRNESNVNGYFHPRGAIAGT